MLPASSLTAAGGMQAADEFERIAKALPDDEPAVRSLATVWHTLGNDQRAIRVLETFISPPRVISPPDEPTSVADFDKSDVKDALGSVLALKWTCLYTSHTACVALFASLRFPEI